MLNGRTLYWSTKQWKKGYLSLKNLDLEVQKRGKTCERMSMSLFLHFRLEVSVLSLQGIMLFNPPGKLSKSPFKTPNFWEQTPVSTPRPEPGLSLLCVCWMLTQGIVVRNRGRHAGLGFQQALPVLRQIFDLPHKVDRQAAALWEGSEVFLT